MKKTRKFLAVVLALVMTVALSAPALAADTEVRATGETTITITSVLNIPTIKVTIGAPTNVIVNPYKLDYLVSDSTSIANKEIVSTASTIKNESGIKVKIEATPTLKTSSNDLKVLTSAPTTTEKALYLAFNMAPVADATAAGSYAGSGTGTVTAATVKANDNTMTPETVNIELAAGNTNATYGAYIFTGSCSGDNWTSADALTELSIVFNILPVVT